MTKKRIGALIILLVMCASLAVGQAITFSIQKDVFGVESYSLNRLVGSTTFVVTGTKTSAMTTGVNAYNGSRVLEVSVSEYDKDSKTYDTDSRKDVLIQGGALFVSVGRDYNDADYTYTHSVESFAVTEISQANASTRVDSAKYVAMQY